MNHLFRITGSILLIVLIQSCKKDKITPPVISTKTVTEISYTTATSGGDATDEGGASIISKGVCWNTSANPTIENNKTTESGGSGAFNSNLTQLTQGTLYYVRAFATNSAGTAYGNQVTFTTSQIEVPVLTTTGITSITLTTAISGGNISDDKGGSVTARGVCWSSATNPTIADSKTTDGTEKGSFVSSISGLVANTTYYVRAYATNSAGTGYGNQVQFNSLIDYSGQIGSVNDIDGNTYPTIGIGSQIWMAKNLVTTKFQDGSSIPGVTDNSIWAGLRSPAYCYYDNSLTNKATYGGLYNFYTIDASANGNKNVCPAGWHVPSDMEFLTLIRFLGEMSAAQKLKESGTSHWLEQNSGTNASGFKALPGGVRINTNGAFDGLGRDGLFWSSTGYGADDADKLLISGDGAGAWISSNKGYGFSIRCLKN